MQVSDWPNLLPEKAQPDHMLFEQKQEETSDKLLTRAPAHSLLSTMHRCVFSYNSANVLLSTPVFVPGIYSVSISTPSPSGEFNNLQKPQQIFYSTPELSAMAEDTA